MKIWTCKIGEVDQEKLPDGGADGPMRTAVERAYEELTGEKPTFTFSGWGGALTEGERAAVEDRLPDHAYSVQDHDDYQWHTQSFEAVNPDQTDIAQQLYDNGMIYLANRVLHIFGYALGVTIDNDKVTGFNLHYSTDAQGVMFDEELELRGRRKLYKAMKRHFATVLGW